MSANERAPTADDLAEEDRRRGEVTVAELLERDLADPETPSRRATPAPSPAAGLPDDDGGDLPVEGMEIPGLRDWVDPEERNG